MANASGGAGRKKSSRKSGTNEDSTPSESIAPQKESGNTSGGKGKAAPLAHESTGISGLYDRTVRYLKSVRTEMGRISWPSMKDLRAATIVVVVTLVIVAAYMGVVDQLLTWVFKTPVATGF